MGLFAPVHDDDYTDMIASLEAENKKIRAELERITAERDEWKRKCEAAVEDFVDYATSGIDNLAPYCINKTKLCTDARGWCKGGKNCKGFYPNNGAEQEEA